ncbi:MAG: hypothetical protein JSR60_05685 [Proteobacteria bacterium]|nr:hypothetical protein [Pseudomonadota bacterium]
MAVVALVCLHSANAIKFNDYGLGQDAVVTTPSGRITIVVSTDNLVTFDWRHADGVCNAGLCVGYYKRCKKAAESISCDYQFSTHLNTLARRVIISAPNAEALAAVERMVGVLDDRDSFAGEVLLSKLTVESRSINPPLCGGRTNPCWPGDKPTY